MSIGYIISVFIVPMVLVGIVAYYLFFDPSEESFWNGNPWFDALTVFVVLLFLITIGLGYQMWIEFLPKAKRTIETLHSQRYVGISDAEKEQFIEFSVEALDANALNFMLVHKVGKPQKVLKAIQNATADSKITREEMQLIQSF